jgi:hypothetical protein
MLSHESNMAGAGRKNMPRWNMASGLIAMALVACGGGGGEEASNATPKAPAEPALAAKPAPAPAAPPVAVATMSKDEMAKQVCFFTPAEIQAALGFSVQAGKPDTKMLSYGRATCLYEGTENSLSIAADWIDPAQVAGARAGMTRMSGGGKTEQIPGDPDAAYFHDQQDNGVSLHYLRGNIRMQVQATSSRTVFATIKPKLLALKRVP